jgi:hypothetical protein
MEAFDAEMYALSDAVNNVEALCEEEGARRVTLFTYSQATL